MHYGDKVPRGIYKRSFVGNEIRNNYIKSRSCNFIVSTAWKNNWEAEYNDLNSFEGFLALEEEAMLGVSLGWTILFSFQSTV